MANLKNVIYKLTFQDDTNCDVGSLSAAINGLC